MNNPSDRTRREYDKRINAAVDHINRNLTGELSLEAVAEAASFSKFHFHRIFSAMTGETVTGYIRRLRVEKAAGQLVATPDKPITDIALECGFSGSAAFARVFKEHYGMSAGEWRDGGYRKICKTDGNPGQTDRTDGKAFTEVSMHIDRVTFNPAWRYKMNGVTDVKVEVQEMEEMTVAYVRHVGPYKGDSALFGRLFGKLMTWAGPRSLLGPDTKTLILYHDSPEITPEEKLRTDCCVSVPEGTEGSGDIGISTVAGGRYAMGKFEINPDQYQDIWDFMCGRWLPSSGYQPADNPPYELCLNDPSQHPEGKHIVAICLPVKPL